MVPFLFLERVVNAMADPKKLYCPKCGRRVGTHDGRSTINFVVKCTRCKRLVIFNPNTGRIFNDKVPELRSSIGTRFY